MGQLAAQFHRDIVSPNRYTKNSDHVILCPNSFSLFCETSVYKFHKIFDNIYF
jgi:hypothetical protein